jgi:hypothetical protein
MSLTKATNRMIEGSLANITDFGAVEGLASAAINTIAIQAAINSGKGILIPVGDWYFDATLTNPDIHPVTCYGKLIYTGNPDDNAFEFGAADATAHQQSHAHINSLYVESNTQSDFTGTHGAGIALINVYNGQFSFGSKYFRVGVLMEGNERGCTYNQVTINRIQDAEIALSLHSTGVGGYVNENVFWGGRFQANGSHVGNTIGVSFSATAAGSILNNNIFYKPSFELINAGAGSAVCFSGDNATLNSVYGCRMEMTGFFLGGSISNNNFEVTRSEFGTAELTDMLLPTTDNDLPTLVANNIYGDIGEEMYIRSADKMISIGRSNVAGYTTGGAVAQVQAPARGVLLSAGATPSFDTRVTAGLQKDHIVLSSGIVALGCVFDLRKVQVDYRKRIDIKFNLEADGGRMAVQCWDSAGNLLAPAGVGYVDNKYVNIGYRIAASYEWYVQEGDRTVARSEERVCFGTDVAYAFIGIVAGTAPAKVKMIEYYTYSISDIIPVSDEATMTTLLNAKLMVDTPDPVTYGTDDPETAIEAGNSYSEGLVAKRLNYAADGNGRILLGHMYDGAAWKPFYASAATWV